MKRKIVSRLLAICLSVSMITAAMLPMTAGAVEGATEKSTVATTEKTTGNVKGTETEKSTTKSDSLYKVKVVIPYVDKATKVSSLSIKQNGKSYTYDYKDLKTDAKGVLYLKLPVNKTGETTTVTVNDVTFSGIVKANDDNALAKSTVSTKKETEKETTKETTKDTVKATESETEVKKTEKESETESETQKTSDQEVKKDAAADRAALDAIAINYVDEKFANTKTGMLYRIGTDGEFENCAADMPIPDGCFGKDVYFKMAGGDYITPAVTVKSRPAAPVVTVTDASATGATNGILKITTVANTTYQYRLKSDTAWKDIDSSGEVKTLKAGTYLVRSKADAVGKNFSSVDAEKTIGESKSEAKLSLSASEVTETYGDAPKDVVLTIKNDGEINANAKIELSGADKDKFKLETSNSVEVGAKGQRPFKVSHNSNLDAGTYTVSVVAINGQGVRSEPLSLKITVNKKMLTVKSVTPKNRTYNGTKTVDLAFALEGSVGNNYTTFNTTGEVSSADSGNGKEIVKDSVNFDDFNKNYTINKESLKIPTVNISQIELVVHITSIKDKKYNESKKAYGSFKVSTRNSQDMALFSKEYKTGEVLSISPELNFEDPYPGKNKTVNIKVTLKKKSGDVLNYKLAESELTGKATINWAENPDDDKDHVKVPNITKYTYNKIEFELVSGQEYRITGGKYGTSGSEWSSTKNSYTDLSALTTYKIETRLAKTKGYLTGETVLPAERTLYRNPITVSTADNKITGVNSSYLKGNTLSFTATGARPTSTTTYSVDDERYVPVSYNAYVNGQWTPNSTDQRASFTVSSTSTGTYYLDVTFMKQTYDGSKWVPESYTSGVTTDTKRVTYTVSTTTSGTGSNYNNNNTSGTNYTTKSGVKTGDTSPIVPLAILLIISGGAVVGLIVVKKRKKVK